MTVLISGGFDPVHVGHCALITSASHYGRVIVALNSDAWLKRKKGYAFMRWLERRDILLMMELVNEVIDVDDSDGSVCAAIEAVKPQYFANGGDRHSPDARERATCQRFGVIELFGVGGKKLRSSSELVGRVKS